MDITTDMDITFVYRGTFIHSTQHTPLQVLEDALLGVNSKGKIAFIGRGLELDELSQIFGFNSYNITQIGPHEFFMPGMVDTHIHACQYSFAGTALDLPLLQWLTAYKFPMESRFEDLEFARHVYTQVVKRTLKNGTTSACYFATAHTDASLLLGQIANHFGQRALVGKVSMDNTLKPYSETFQESKEETCRFIGELLKKKYTLVRPVVTPGSAMSCSGPLMEQLGEIAKSKNLHIQSHISEVKEQLKIIKMFPESESYTDVYYKHGLLTDKTVLAHGCYLSDEELELFRETGASLSHCPNSNISQHIQKQIMSFYQASLEDILCSGMLDVRKVLSHKVKLGLGTDLAAGYSASMLDAVRRTMDTSNVLSMQNPDYHTLTFEEVFRLATLGGSQALSMDDQTGNFEVGKDFDALRVNVAVPGGPIDLFENDGPKVLLEKFLKLGDDRNIVEVHVAGKKVVPFAGPADIAE